jgi:lysophospholipase L1-like esterase
MIGVLGAKRNCGATKKILRAALLLVGAWAVSGVTYGQAPSGGEANKPVDAQNATPVPSGVESLELTETKAQLATATMRLLDAQRTLHDWANLGRYREANAKLAAPAAGEKRVVFMGDSITDAWAEPRFGGFFPGKPYVDRGISGQTTPQMLIRFRPDVVALGAKAVVILAGTNDIAGNTGPMTFEEIEGNLQSMAELAKENGIRVVMASVMPVSDYGHTGDGHALNMTKGRPPEKILELNAWIKKYAAEHHEIYLDYFSATVDEKGFLKAELSGDGLHPNAAGYAVMAPLAEAAIEKALKK